jgi:hypothetical protein
LSRRTFLAASAGLVVAAACGGDDDDADGDGSTTSRTPTTSPQPDDFAIAVGTSQVFAGREMRMSFALLKDNALLPGGTAVSLRWGRDFSSLGPAASATYHDEGIEDRAFWTANVAFEEPGEYVLAATAGDLGGSAGIEVLAPNDSPVPQEGAPMVSVATPTTTDARGVDPICTRTPEHCPFHDVSLDNALTEGRPVVVLFSTPALCQSRICGPVVEMLVGEAPAYQDRVRFVHVEVYKSLTAGLSTDAITDGMKAYNLTFEPVLYLAGADRVIQRRIDGPFDRGELRTWLAELTA